MAGLKDRFEEMIHLTWSEFVELEKDGNTSVEDMTLCSLIRACANSSNSTAIKIAFDRADGALETPIEIRVPKFYMRYMNAKEVEVGDIDTTDKVAKKEEAASTYDPATAKLRETLQEMRKMPQQVIGLVLGHKQSIEEGGNPQHDPMVKSVMVANLLYNASRGKISAIDLIFDQIDGKLTKTITLLGGEDVYVDDYTTEVAPIGSVKDENGHYIAENKAMTNIWIRGFANSKKGLEVLAEGLEDER